MASKAACTLASTPCRHLLSLRLTTSCPLPLPLSYLWAGAIVGSVEWQYNSEHEVGAGMPHNIVMNVLRLSPGSTAGMGNVTSQTLNTLHISLTHVAQQLYGRTPVTSRESPMVINAISINAISMCNSLLNDLSGTPYRLSYGGPWQSMQALAAAHLA